MSKICNVGEKQTVMGWATNIFGDVCYCSMTKPILTDTCLQLGGSVLVSEVNRSV